MKRAIGIISLLMIAFCVKSAFSQSISYWNDSTSYERGKDIVIFQGIRYIAARDNLGARPDIFSEGNVIWERIVPFRASPSSRIGARLFPQAHRNVRDMLTEIDGFVIGVDRIYGFNTVGKIRSVATFREKDIVGDYLHSSWNNFMVDDFGDEISGLFRLEEISDSKDGINLNITDNMRERYYELIRPRISREYLNYKNVWRDHYRWAFGAILAPGLLGGGILPIVPNERISAFEQMVHNIGDAMVAFGHALGDLSGTSNDKKDIREAGNEYGIRKAINRESERQAFVRHYFTGSIYDAIAEYGIRSIEAINWAKQNIEKIGDCDKRGIGSVMHVIYNDECYNDNSANFQRQQK